LHTLSWINANAVALGFDLGLLTLAASLATLAVSAWRYTAVRRAEQRHQRYVNYHRLISELVDPGQHGIGKLDSQIAIIYELQFYREYSDVTKRILKQLPKEWKDVQERVLEEIALTVKALGG
jgi:hypothetical protein